MTESKRIIFNTAVTYARSLYALLLGLFSSRWVFNALGERDMGLFGVVGSMIALVVFFNNVMSAAVSRFYAFSIGEAKAMQNDTVGINHVGKWFNVAFSTHTFLPLLLIAIGYPIGIYAIHNGWIVVPPDRIDACVWVFRCSMISAFIAMVSVPYLAMYRAYQFIAELSFWGLLSSTIMFAIAYCLPRYDGDRLVMFAVLSTITPLCITSIQVYRARKHFPACRIHLREMFNRDRFKAMLSYVAWDFWGCLGDLIRQNGTAFVINRNFPPAMNAAYSISAQVNSHTTALSSAMLGALTPAVTTAEGSGDHEKAKNLAYRSCKFGAVLILLFAIPLIIEIDEVLKLWLVHPPKAAATICSFVLLSLVCHKLGLGLHLMIIAKGRIAVYQLVAGIVSASAVLMAYIFVKLGMGAMGVGLAFLLDFAALTMLRLVFARRLVAMSIIRWMKDVLLPVGLYSLFVAGIGIIPRLFLGESFGRVCLTSLMCLVVGGVAGYLGVCSADEKQYIRSLFAFRKRRGSGNGR